MRIRNVLKEFEAHLKPVHQGSKVTGKSEWKQYGDGAYRFKISIRKTDLPDGSQVDVLLQEKRVMQLVAQDGKAIADLESPIRVELPSVQAGDLLRIRFGESILAEGVFKAE
ncbi:MAG: hypothetical protein IT314_07540 [Anaerolineales bacterium]|nr:hypothetical protein [Anaerolineales bacterium]